MSTDADREKALWAEIQTATDDGALAAIAAALAEERRKAREPFLALADELDLIPLDQMEIRRFVRKLADRIRRTAEESGE